jgi:hypothetical protein
MTSVLFHNPTLDRMREFYVVVAVDPTTRRYARAAAIHTCDVLDTSIPPLLKYKSIVS